MLISAALVLLIACDCAYGFASYVNRIPNGALIPNPCAAGFYWTGSGHQAPAGGGTLTQFGVDFRNAGNAWTRQLCQADSDGDGLSNGRELGDPNCVWSVGQANPSAAVSNPAVCEPITSSACTRGSNNAFLSSIGCNVQPVVTNAPINVATPIIPILPGQVVTLAPVVTNPPVIVAHATHSRAQVFSVGVLAASAAWLSTFLYY